jgi:uncharacterized protein (TIGR00369 family)
MHADLGIRIESAEPGEVRLSWAAAERHRNVQGLVHGGLIAALADSAMGFALRSVVGPGRRHVTIDMTVRFIRPVGDGSVTAEGTVVHAGTRIGFAEAEVRDEDGRVIAKASGTYDVANLRG